MLSKESSCSGGVPFEIEQTALFKLLPGIISFNSIKKALSEDNQNIQQFLTFVGYNSLRFVSAITKLSYSEPASISNKVISCSFSQLSEQTKNDVI
jgi:hypothetical protein